MKVSMSVGVEADMLRNTVLYGNCLDRLAEIPNESIQTCVTGPPYYGLRDYGTRRWFGGEITCEHDIEQGRNVEAVEKSQTATTAECNKCGAWYGQLGLEPTPEKYVEHMVLTLSLGGRKGCLSTCGRSR